MPTSVLFVCLGNICRSPMAEGVLKTRLIAEGRAADVHVDSAGTAAWHVGKPPDPRTAAVLRARGAWHPMSARQVRDDDFERFDWILAMDSSNLDDLRARCPAAHRGKLHLVLAPVGGADVPDPYYGGPGGFDAVYSMIDEAIDVWMTRI